MRVALFFLIIAFVSCSSAIKKTSIFTGSAQSGEGIRFDFSGAVPPSFRSRLMIRCAAALQKRLHPVVRKERYRVIVRLAPVERDFTPIICILPPLLSYLGCPQGSVSRRFSLRVVAADGRILSVWQGKVRRPFGLYYMIPAAERRMHDEMLRIAGKALITFFTSLP